MPLQHSSNRVTKPRSELRPARSRGRRAVMFALGWVFFGLGVLVALLPVLPTTPFMILALWAFSQSSERLHHWLYTHPRFGPRLQQWHQHRVIPRSARLTAYGVMVASMSYVLIFSRVPWPLIALMGAVMLCGAVFISRCPSQPPRSHDTGGQPPSSEDVRGQPSSTDDVRGQLSRPH